MGLKWHHYGKRMFDPVIARFTGVDPISDQFAWVSTYNYAENEPVANIDLHGLQKFSFQNLIQRGLEWLGYDWNTVSKGPKNQEHAQQISENRNKWDALGEGAQAVFDIQSVFIPGASLINPNSTGTDIGFDLATSFVPFAKAGKLGKFVDVGLDSGSEVVKVADEASTALKEALSGGNHSGFLRNVLKTNANISKSIKSLTNNIKKHQDYIDDPTIKFGERWDTFDDARKQREINHWKKEINAFSDQRDILNDINN